MTKAVSSLAGPAFFLLAALCLQAQAPTLPQLARARDAANRNAGITDVEKKQILALYDEALESMQSSLRFQAAALGQERKLGTARKELETLKQDVQRPTPLRASSQPADATSGALEEALAQAITDRDARAKSIADLSKLAVDLTRRREEINQRRADLRRELENADDQLAIVQLTSVSEPWEQAARAQLGARKQAIEAEIAALGAERSTLEVLLEQIPYQRELGKQRLEAAEHDIEDLKERGRKAREHDALVELERIRKLAREDGETSKALRGIALDVETLAGRMYGPAGALASLREITLLDGKAAQQLQRLRQLVATTQRRYEASTAFSPATDWLQPLPVDALTIEEIRAIRNRYVRRLPELRKQMVSLEEQLGHESALETQIQQLKAEEPNASADFEGRARTLLQLRRRLLDDLLATDRQLETRLVEFAQASRQGLEETIAFEQYVWKHVLWARSAPVGLLGSFSVLVGGMKWFLDNPEWRIILTEAAGRGAFYVVWIPIGLLILALLLVQSRFRRALRQPVPDDASEGRSKHSMRRALINTLLAAGGPAALLYWLHWLFASDQMPPLGIGIAAGLKFAADVLFVVCCVHEIMAEAGLGETWLHIPALTCRAIRAQTSWLRYAFPLLGFVSSALLSEGGLLSEDLRLQHYHNGLGRLAFLAALACVLIAVHRVYRVLPALPGNKRRRTRFALLSMIGALMLLAISGFYITALFLTVNLLKTAVLTAILALLFALLVRWRDRNRLAGTEPTATFARGWTAPASQVMQLSRFMATIAWIIVALVIWSDAFPAFSMLRNVEILPQPRIVRSSDVQTPAASDQKAMVPTGAPAAATATMPGMPATGQSKPSVPFRSSLKPLTLLDVIYAILGGMFAAFLIKNIPGVLELTILRRMKLDKGAIYAVNTIARYFITFLAIGTISSLLGIQWTQIQWIAAALTFGIGFGLQDIFANFAAGLILLFDRSLRVGDAVSLGELSGRVSEIKMRATTVTLWDRSEMIVPNKEFISSKLINWTLSIPETRVDVKVGVVYGSELDLVRKVLFEVARANLYVLKAPPPEVFLTAFAESAVNFELRAYCLYDEGRMKVLDELYTAVYRQFAQHGIQIAFPQLDVHLKGADVSAPEPAGGS